MSSNVEGIGIMATYLSRLFQQDQFLHRVVIPRDQFGEIEAGGEVAAVEGDLVGSGFIHSRDRP